jgi:hypothetical protein
MPVSYTITSDDVSSVSVTSKLRAGVRFDWSDQKIYIPVSVNQVTAQFLIDNCRFAEATFIGSARPRIVVGAGAVQIGIDPDTLSPIATPTVAIFDENWKVITEKTSGNFVVKDIYMNLDAETPIPYDDVNGVFIQYLTSVTGAVATVSTSGGSATLANQTAIIDTLTSIQGGGFDGTTDSLEKIRDAVTIAINKANAAKNAASANL